MTKVTLTGTGSPAPHPSRAGGGVLIQTESLNLQFDAGRATAMRLGALKVWPMMLDAVFLTHHHSDHLLGLDDLALTRWVFNFAIHNGGVPPETSSKLPVVAPDGPLRSFLDRLLTPWEDDIDVRKNHVGEISFPGFETTMFEVSPTPEVVWEKDSVRVLASAVHHEPVIPAVGYRIETPDGVVAISGDTNVCDEVKVLADGADILVHEAVLTNLTEGTPGEILNHYHSHPEDIGRLAKEAGVKTLMLTHLAPPPEILEEGDRMFIDATRAGGFDGELIVGNDLSDASFG